jgi:hypothetical protein
MGSAIPRSPPAKIARSISGWGCARGAWDATTAGLTGPLAPSRLDRMDPEPLPFDSSPTCPSPSPRPRELPSAGRSRDAPADRWVPRLWLARYGYGYQGPCPA